MMSRTWVCPNGHVSTDPENCPQCGEQIQPADNGGIAPVPGAATSTVLVDAGHGGVPPSTVNADGSRTCHAPDGHGGECGQVNPAGDLWCQRCQAPLDAPAPPPVPAPAPSLPAGLPPAPAGMPAASPATLRSPAAVGISAAAPNGWQLVATVDPVRAAAAHDASGQGIEVVDDARLSFPLVVRESLIGRRSDAREVYPEVELTDPAVSRPHAMVRQEPDGSLTYHHLSAKSGSLVDGVRLSTGRSAPLRPGSVIAIGAYTEITVLPR